MTPLNEQSALYVQIAKMLEDGILRGIYREDEQVPSTNELASRAPLTLLGLFAGGVYRRFGRMGGYVLYFAFILICVSTGRILDGAESLFSAGLGLPLAAAAAVLLAGMAALGARWLLILDN